MTTTTDHDDERDDITRNFIAYASSSRHWHQRARGGLPAILAPPSLARARPPAAGPHRRRRRRRRRAVCMWRARPGPMLGHGPWSMGGWWLVAVGGHPRLIASASSYILLVLL